ncbi:MAG: ATP-binding protein [Chloroflexi bacterium]|nr:ATP-binding protein [Chloroflexota bacterium]
MNSPSNVSPESINFESDFRISVAPLTAALAVVGTLVTYLAYQPEDPFDRLVVLALGLSLLVLVPLVVWLDRRRSSLSRWIAILALTITIHVMSLWLGPETAFAMAPIMVALAAASVGLRGAAGVALLQAVFLLAQPSTAETHVSPTTVAIGLVALLTIYLVMVAVYHPVWHVGQWVKDSYWQARTLADEAQQRRAEYEQVLKDLAQANLQLTRLNTIAQALRHTAEAARTAKEQFVANVSHELRTPLNMIIGFSEMVLQSPEMYGNKLPPALLADLAVIHRNAEHLTELIDDVLDLSQIETDQMALTKEHVQFCEVVESAALAVRPLYESKGLYLRLHIPEQLPAVFCDPTRMREVLLNLLSNAGRFTESGGVNVRVSLEVNEIVVTVADTGRGIAAKDMGKLFEPFQQLDSTIRRYYGGTGLGLSISKRFIELHGGTITVESEPGIGTAFTFRLPIVPPAPLSGDSTRWLTPDWAYLQRTGASKAPKSVVRPRLLVLEAGEMLQRLLKRYMEGAEIVPVATMEQALDALQNTPAQALVINGASIARGLDLLKSSSALPAGVPALVCVVPDPHDTSTGLRVSEFLIKPISQQTLLDTLDRLGVTQGTVLIVDDEPDGRQLFSRMLASSKRGYRVLQARDGEEAMGILYEYRADVILLDLIMPNMDGFEMLAALNESPSLRDIPKIVISAQDPAGQPIMSSALAVVQAGGISARQLLTCVAAMTRILSATQDDEPALQATPVA